MEFQSFDSFIVEIVSKQDEEDPGRKENGSRIHYNDNLHTYINPTFPSREYYSQIGRVGIEKQSSARWAERAWKEDQFAVSS